MMATVQYVSSGLRLPFLRMSSAPQPGEEPSSEGSAETNKQRLKIAIAEDNRADVLLVQEALAHHRIDADLSVYRDGEEMFRAIEGMERGEIAVPDLFLLDLNLPRRSGQALLARIRQSEKLGMTPVVIVTSSDATKDRSSTTDLGASRYFRKPSDFDEFLKLGEVVRELTGR